MKTAASPILHWHLKEALEALTEVTDELATAEKFDENYFRQMLAQVYHHLNTGWSARFDSEEYWAEKDMARFYERRMFPADFIEELSDPQYEP